LKNKSKAVDIAFLDISSLSGPMKALYLLLAYTAIGLLMYLFYIKLVSKKEEEEEKRLAKLEAKRVKREKKKN
jgi:putative exporter of polyketide antibiotics